MPYTCPRCSRSNPPHALFCFYDGQALSNGASRQSVDPARRRFPMPFVFPTGLACNSFDELVLGVQNNWGSASELLRHGVFASFFGGLGRADLVVAARESAHFPDPDRGLAQLLTRLPSSVLEPPRLIVEPGQVNLGSVRPGQDVRFDLHLSNQGMSLVAGSISCEDCPWLVLGEPDSVSKNKLFQFLHETTISVHVRGKSLGASNKPLTARLLIDSSGGQVEVSVKLEVPVLPFPDGVLGGAVTPRQIAEKAKAKPKEAADLFASGAVARWYSSNGWTYPVQEPSASGLAAVQQFFEALGLTSPPKVGISASEIRLSGRAGESVRSSVHLTTSEKKPVFAHAVSDQPWLNVNQVELEGRSATVHLRVAEVPDRDGETLHAKLTVISNGRQKFVLPVSLLVAGRPPVRARVAAAVTDQVIPITPFYPGDQPHLPPDPSPLSFSVVQTSVEVAQPTQRTDLRSVATPDDSQAEVKLVAVGRSRPWLALLPVIFLVLGLSVTLGRDLFAWGRKPAPVSAGVEDWSRLPQPLHIAFHDRELEVTLASSGSVKPLPGREQVNTVPGVWEPSMRFGLELDAVDGTGRRKKLTFNERGETNNTVVLLDGVDYIFGERPFRTFDGRYQGRWPGRWLQREAPLDRQLRDGRRSIWVYDNQQVMVTQTVGLVPGAQSRRIDTCLVHYRMDNRDTKPHSIGLRFLLDTFIGSNDAVPFLIPGSPQLCDDRREFRSPAEVPDFIQARETDNLSQPGTIAQIQLRIPGLEPPSRVTLGALPNPDLGGGCLQEKTMWEVPLFSIKALPKGPDSAVTIYWNPITLRPGAFREVAFAYGLGTVSAGEAGGQLGLSVAGSFAPRGEFTLTAEVRNPAVGQRLTLNLPPEFGLVGGSPSQQVPAAGAGRTSAVTWKVRAGPSEGAFALKVTSSTGVSQTQKVDIKVRGIFGS